MTTFQEDWEAAHRKVYGLPPMPDLPKKKVVHTKRVKKARAVDMSDPATRHINKLKKRGPSKQVLSENAKQQPRADGKFAKKSGASFLTRLGWIFSGKAKRKVNASIRAQKKRDAARGQAVILVERKPRRRRTK